MRRTLRRTLLATIPLGTVALPSPAMAYDIDCKVILCLASGFPAGCRDAYRYMIDRITDFPPKPPFGFCAMSNGTRYQGTDLDFATLSGRASYLCPEGARLSYNIEYADRGPERVRAFCYRSSRVVTEGYGRDRRTYVTYTGRTAPTRARYRLAVTVEPGTPSEYRSPVFYINGAAGIVSQRPR